MYVVWLSCLFFLTVNIYKFAANCHKTASIIRIEVCFPEMSGILSTTVHCQNPGEKSWQLYMNVPKIFKSYKHNTSSVSAVLIVLQKAVRYDCSVRTLFQ
jgi:hypothetical protein